MTRLLIQCQGSPGPLSFKITQAKADAILHHYLNLPQHSVAVPLISDDGSTYYINLTTVSWICATDESGITLVQDENDLEPEPEGEPKDDAWRLLRPDGSVRVPF